jgi:hypothetical protein
MKRATLYLVPILLCLSTLGCELVATFDRDKIPKGSGGTMARDSGMDARQEASTSDTDAEGPDSATPAEAGRDAGTDTAVLGCGNDKACLDEQYCSDDHACVTRLGTTGNNPCTRDRQCASGGGCCQGVCISLSQELHCGTSQGDDRTTCGDVCASDQYCDKEGAHTCQPRLANDGTHSCGRDRQCAAGGGCCQLSGSSIKCIVLNQNTHCGVSAGDDKTSCGVDCTSQTGTAACVAGSAPGCGCAADAECAAEQYCDTSTGRCVSRLVNDGTQTCARNRQCATGGGCCNKGDGLKCFSLSAADNCGQSGDGNSNTCGTNCAAQATHKVCVSDSTPVCGECNADSDCATGSGCCNHVCGSLTQNDQCGVAGCGTDCTVQAANKVCVDDSNDGTPVCGECNTDSDCASGSGCCGHVCVSLAQNSHCGATGCGADCAVLATNKVCYNSGTPSCGCNTDSDCATGSGCCNHVCGSLTRDSQCGENGCGTNCSALPTNKVCYNSGTPICGCNTDSDCASGSGCCNHVCGSLTRDSNCGATGCGNDCTALTTNKVCYNNAGTPSCGCNADSDCASGSGCCNHTCVSLTQNNHCGATGCGTNCSAHTTDKVCYNNAGTPACGCNADSDCASGSGCCNHLCVSLTQNNQCGVTGCGNNCTLGTSNTICISGTTPHCGCRNSGNQCAAPTPTCNSTTNLCGT